METLPDRPCRFAAVMLGVVLLVGCQVEQVHVVGSGLVDVPPDEVIDAAVDGDVGPGARPLPACETDADCPAGSDCHTIARVCTECVASATRCGEDGARELCEKPEVVAAWSAGSAGAVTGGVYLPDPCPDEERCAMEGQVATCQPAVCEAARSWCTEDGRVERCNGWGTAVETQVCSPGFACYQGGCEPIRHNVLLVFDTSGSMNSYIHYQGTPGQCEVSGLPCLKPFPECDPAETPLTLITRAKAIFSQVLDTLIGGFSQFALQRFPQRPQTYHSGSCYQGWYQPQNRMTGDDDSFATEEGGWFDAGLSEVVVVPFPDRRDRENREALARWMDGVEALSPTGMLCEDNADCPDGWSCRPTTNGRECYIHSEPELRGGGETPLGKSLFYAGEYFRRYVVIDGQPCVADADCASAGYVCTDSGECRDPYRHCKENVVVLFTDGFETQFQDTTEFFNPALQAKRLAYGLTCAEHVDCRGGATCVDGQCVGPDQTIDSVLQPGPGQAFSALSSPNGEPISVKVNVVTLTGVNGTSGTLNAATAEAGGGTHLDVSADDPERMREKLLEVMQVRYKCYPQDL